MDLQDRGSERRLATILVADVVGFSRWMEADESAALAAINRLLGDLLEPIAIRHVGRLVKRLGDGALVEFASPVEAVLCAVELQAALAELREQPEEDFHKLQLRIGINFGDTVVSRDGDLHGDSVNVAARLEAMAEPNGICISEKVFSELEGKLTLPFEDRGEQRLKNIARPIRTYSLKIGASSVASPGRHVRLRAGLTSRRLPFSHL